MSWKRAPVPLAGAVEALAARVEPLTTLARVQRAWPEAGALFARHAEPVSQRGGVVPVRCGAGACWRPGWSPVGAFSLLRVVRTIWALVCAAPRCHGGRAACGFDTERGRRRHPWCT